MHHQSKNIDWEGLEPLTFNYYFEIELALIELIIQINSTTHTGLEPATTKSTILHSTIELMRQLAIIVAIINQKSWLNVLCKTRTCNILIRSQIFYPIELIAHSHSI